MILHPILPIKLIGFTECIHMIAFLDSDEYDSIEFMKYKNSVSGEGIELILTDKTNKQVIFANNPLSVMNIRNSGREVYEANIKIESIDNSSLVKFDLLSESKIHTIHISFESLFPISDIRSGKIDPKRHNTNGMPFMYSSRNTVGKKATVCIDGVKSIVKLSCDPMLKEFGGLQVYYSKNFNLAVISAHDDTIQCKENNENEMYYITKNNEIKVVFKDANTGLMSCSNYVDEFHYEFKMCEKGLLKELKLFYNDENTITLTFENIDISEHEVSGIMKIEFVKDAIDFVSEVTIREKNTNKNQLEQIMTIKHNNDDWEEQNRTLEIHTLYELFDVGKKIKTMKIKKIALNT